MRAGVPGPTARLRGAVPDEGLTHDIYDRSVQSQACRLSLRDGARCHRAAGRVPIGALRTIRRRHGSERPSRPVPSTQTSPRGRRTTATTRQRSTSSSTDPPVPGEVVLGVDTHGETHAAAVVSPLGKVLGTESVRPRRPATVGRSSGPASWPSPLCAESAPSSTPLAVGVRVGSTTAATARPTPPCTASCSPGCASIPAPRRITNVALRRARPDVRSSDASSDMPPERSSTWSGWHPASPRYRGVWDTTPRTGPCTTPGTTALPVHGVRRFSLPCATSRLLLSLPCLLLRR